MTSHMNNNRRMADWGLAISVVFWVLHALCGTAVCGQEAPPVLALEDAFKTALTKNPMMKQAEASRKKAGAQVLGSISAFLPKVNLEAGFSRSDNPVMVFSNKLNQADFQREDFDVNTLNNPDYRSAWQARFVMTQPVFNQGREYIGYKISRIVEDMSDLGLRSTGQAVLFMVEKA
jgi:outer membrane protein TolC